MRLLAVLFFCLVPFLALRDAGIVFYDRCIEGFDLVREMWLTA